MKTCSTERFAFYAFCVSAVAVAFGYGVAVGMFQLFPYQVFATAEKGFLKLRASSEWPWYYTRIKSPDQTPVNNTGLACGGLNLVTQIEANDVLSAKIMDMDGETLHKWTIDWFKIWPDAEHLPSRWIPQSAPGTHIHGATVLENGDLVFNFEHLGLVRLDLAGKVVWRLPYQTHHSVTQDEKGNLWVCGQKEHTERDARFPNRKPPFEECTILELTADGTILHEWSVEKLLRKNGYAGLMFLGTQNNDSTEVEADVLHLNDVEPFPDSFAEGFFTQGDILVSLRNINTFFVFNCADEKISFISVGECVRQHDPDFVDGNTISVFDNNLTSGIGYLKSRILLFSITSASDKKVKTIYEGTPSKPFFSSIMGKHQWLPNGNLLITESCRGRAFEIDRNGETVWQYTNLVDKGVVGIIEEVKRLSPEGSRPFLPTESAESESNRHLTESRRNPAARTTRGG